MKDKRFKWQTSKKEGRILSISGKISKHGYYDNSDKQNIKDIEPNWNNFLKKSMDDGIFKDKRLINLY